MVTTTLPDAAVLIEAAREAMAAIPVDPLHRDKTAKARQRAASKALSAWAPAIDEATDLAGVAAFLGARLDTLKRRRWRARADGSPDWPAPDVKVGQTDGWTYRTVVLEQATRPGRGRHGSALAPVPENVPAMLAVSDIADHFGVAANTVHSWRTRYPDDCPEPDVVVGLKHPQAGWRQDRLGEWDEFRESMPGQGAGGGRPENAS